jgi:2-polyprenyl-6-methoxyphenol hydroxylase-like FAD-dependent oxidoreductase
VIAVRHGAKVSSLVEEDGRVVGVRGLRHGKEEFEVRADVVVGADGRYSTVAKLGKFEVEYEHHDFDLVWFTVAQPPGWSSTLYISLGSEVRGLLLPKYPHHIQAGIALPTGVWRQWRQQGVAFVADRVRRLDPIFGEFAAGLKDFNGWFAIGRATGCCSSQRVQQLREDDVRTLHRLQLRGQRLLVGCVTVVVR